MKTAPKPASAPGSGVKAPRRRSTAPAQRSGAPKKRAPRASRLQKLSAILAEAEQQFARFGLEGVSLDSIAAGLAISRQNLLYYYASKEDLYVAVLDDVMESWIRNMEVLSKNDDPQAAISSYVRAKLRFSQERPSGSAVFVREVLAGMPFYASTLAERVTPKLRADVRAFERWARQGLIERVDFTQLMFVIWSATQAYADSASQFALFMGKRQLDDADYAAAHELIVGLVLSRLMKRP